MPSRTPLRVKLLATVLALVVVALGIISLAGVQALKSYLIGQEDTKLQTTLQGFLNSGHLPEHPFAGQPSGSDYRGSLQGLILAILTPQHKIVLASWNISDLNQAPAMTPGAAWLTSGAATRTRPGTPVTVDAVSGGGKWQVLAFTDPNATFSTITPSGTTYASHTLIIGVDITRDYGTINWLIHIDLLVSALVLFGIGIAGLALVRVSLRPLNEIEETAEAIAAGDLSRRVPEADPRTEIGSLGHSLNTMLAQIEAAFAARTKSEATARRSEERMRQFVADASHELRTPLTTIRGFAEYYRQRGGVDGTDELVSPAALLEDLAAAASSARERGKLSHAELDRLIKRVEQEAARMGVLVEDLLLLARLDQQRPLEFRTVDLLAIAADTVHDARVMAPRRAITLTIETSQVPLVPGDEVRLRQVVGNLMNNALTHTPADTPIELTISAGTLGTPNGAAPVPAVVFKVADHGPGLTQEQADHVFERFYRTDRARTRTAGGTGLGLAIVAALVAAHHGQVWVESIPGTGTTFSFALPLSPEALDASLDAALDAGHDDETADQPATTPPPGQAGSA